MKTNIASPKAPRQLGDLPRMIPRIWHTSTSLLVAAAFSLVPRAMASDVETILGPKEPIRDENGQVEPGQLEFPFSVDFDAADRMYIVEYTGGRIHRLSPGGELAHIGGQHRVAGYSGDGGPALEATFNLMHNVVVLNDGDLLISDHKNNAVRRLDANSQTMTTYAGNRNAGFSGDGGSADEKKVM